MDQAGGRNGVKSRGRSRPALVLSEQRAMLSMVRPVVCTCFPALAWREDFIARLAKARRGLFIDPYPKPPPFPPKLLHARIQNTAHGAMKSPAPRLW